MTTPTPETVSIEERIEAALRMALEAQRSYVLPEQVDVAALAAAVAAELGMSPEWARGWDAKDGRRQHFPICDTYAKALSSGSTLKPDPVEVRYVTGWYSLPRRDSDGLSATLTHERAIRDSRGGRTVQERTGGQE